MKPLSLKIDDALYALIEAQASVDGVSISEAARSVLATGLTGGSSHAAQQPPACRAACPAPQVLAEIRALALATVAYGMEREAPIQMKIRAILKRLPDLVILSEGGEA